jgi:phosphoglycolate phosphatase
MLRAVLFDLDGTLVDTPKVIVEVTQATLAALGRPPAPEQEIRDGIGLPLPEALSKLGVEPMAAVEIYRNLWRSTVSPRIPQLAYPGVREGIDELRAMDLRLGVVTGKAQEGADSTVDLLGLRAQMQVVLGYTSVARGKPAPDLALEALKRLDVAPCDALVVGDTTLDLEMSRAAGVPFLAVTYGAQPREALLGADGFAHSFPEVVRIVRERARLGA